MEGVISKAVSGIRHAAARLRAVEGVLGNTADTKKQGHPMAGNRKTRAKILTLYACAAALMLAALPLLKRNEAWATALVLVMLAMQITMLVIAGKASGKLPKPRTSQGVRAKRSRTRK